MQTTRSTTTRPPGYVLGIGPDGSRWWIHPQIADWAVRTGHGTRIHTGLSGDPSRENGVFLSGWNPLDWVKRGAEWAWNNRDELIDTAQGQGSNPYGGGFPPPPVPSGGFPNGTSQRPDLDPGEDAVVFRGNREGISTDFAISTETVLIAGGAALGLFLLLRDKK